MKKIIFFIFFVFISIGYSQNNKTLVEQTSNQLKLGLATGISSPSGTFSNKAFAGEGSFVEASAAYYFPAIGLGLSIGQYSNPTEGNFSNFSNSQFTDLSVSTINSTENWKTSYYGIGPEFKASLGDAFEAIFSTRIGSMSIKPIDLRSEISIGNADVATSIPIVRFGTTETSKLSYYSAGIKLAYNLSDKFSLQFMANYLSSLSKEITLLQEVKQVSDTNRNGIIDQEDFITKDGTPLQFTTSQVVVKPQSTNFGIGLTYTLHKKTIKIGGAEKPYARGHTNPAFQEAEMQGEMPTRNNGSVIFTNPAKEKVDREKKKQKLVNVLPKNNSNFNRIAKIESFTWEQKGYIIPNPQYVIEVVKTGKNKQPQRTYIAKTTKTSIKASILFKDEELSDGNYTWKVTETTTGTISNPSYFTMTQCDIDFTISNDTIECLGYVGSNRKFKVCFDATYSSTSGNLTYLDSLSGLTVYDQTYATLSHTLVSPNLTLVSQIGATTSTVSYCFEVTVSSSVTSIGFGLQGDDLDPSPITCQPGVSQLFDELPSCLCDECDRLEVSFDDFNISLNTPYGNQFNFNGNINVNVPIYGMEFQVQSYSYSAAPSACSEGVSSIEESGIFLMPGTSINGSTTLQLFNETASGSSSSNDNATKDIKYTSNSPLTGPIPINLTIGLPGPISGLDPSCCIIEYTVCIKVKVFYEEGNCKSCVFTHCFKFNNQ